VERADAGPLYRRRRRRALAEGGREELSAEQREFEALSLSLRTPRGVPLGELERSEELEGLVEQIDAGPC